MAKLATISGMLRRYTADRPYRGCAGHAGAQDTSPRADVTIVGEARALDRALTAKGIGDTFEIYDGGHIDRIAERFESKVLPFFSNNLVFREK